MCNSYTKQQQNEIITTTKKTTATWNLHKFLHLQELISPAWAQVTNVLLTSSIAEHQMIEYTALHNVKLLWR